MSEITTSFLNPPCSRELNAAEFCDKLALKYLNRDISTSELYVTVLKSSSPLLVTPIARPHQEVRIETNNGN
jgi:hypothetical protein